MWLLWRSNINNFTKWCFFRRKYLFNFNLFSYWFLLSENNKNYNTYYLYNNTIFNINYKSYNCIIKNNFNKSVNKPLTFSRNFKYSWIYWKTDAVKYFSEKHNNIEFTQFFKLDNFYIDNQKLDNLRMLIGLKSKSGSLKKFEKVDFIFKSMYKGLSHVIKKKTKENTKINVIKFKKDKWKMTFPIFKKTNIIFYEKRNLIYLKNKKIFLLNLNKKVQKRYKYPKYTKNIIKSSILNFLNFFEFSLVNSLVRTSFFFNKSDAIFFVKNGYVNVNGFEVIDENYTLKINDVVNIIYNDDFFIFYRNYVQKTLNYILSFNDEKNKDKNYYIPSIVKTDYKRKTPVDHEDDDFFEDLDEDDQKQKVDFFKYTRNDYNNEITSFKRDIPNFFEVDFISMSYTIIYSYNDYDDYDYFNTKLLNVYLKRLYNWREVN
jgi:ribosomal protein S4